ERDYLCAGLLEPFNISGVILMNVCDECVFHGLRRDGSDLCREIVVKRLTKIFRVDKNYALIGYADRRVATAVDHHINAWLDLLDHLRRWCLCRATGALSSACICASSLSIAARGSLAFTASSAPLSVCRRLLAALWSLCRKNEWGRCQSDHHRKSNHPF